jgi:hypothetical protein
VADPGVGIRPVVEVQVGAADRGEATRTIASFGCSIGGTSFSSTRIL